MKKSVQTFLRRTQKHRPESMISPSISMTIQKFKHIFMIKREHFDKVREGFCMYTMDGIDHCNLIVVRELHESM
jgi:hypothetical protein